VKEVGQEKFMVGTIATTSEEAWYGDK